MRAILDNFTSSFLILDCFLLLDFSLNTLYTFEYIFIPFNYTFFFLIKFLAALFFLIFIRAGLPRYRYDYLSILGWSRLLVFIIFFLFFFYFFFSLLN